MAPNISSFNQTPGNRNVENTAPEEFNLNPDNSEPTRQKLHVHHIIGKKGLWQTVAIIVVVVFHLLAACHYMAMNYMAPETMAYICIAFNDNKPLRDMNDPDAANNTECYQKNISGILQKCSKWEYNNSEFESIASRYDLVCDDKHKIASSKKLYETGYVTALFILGYIANGFSRIPVVIMSGFALIVCAFASFSASTFEQFSVLRFVVSTTATCLSLTSHVSVMEMISPAQRTILAILCTLTWPTAEMLMTFTAPVLASWNTILMLLSIPTIICVPLICCYAGVPLRWAALHRKESLVKLCARFARCMNKISNRRTDVTVSQYTLMMSQVLNKYESCCPMISLAHSKNLFWCSAVTFLNWFIIYYCQAYFSAMSSKLLGISFQHSFAVDIPEIIAGCIIMKLANVFNRLMFLSYFLFAAAIFGGFETVALLQGSSGSQIGLAIASRIFLSCATAFIHLITVEIFPTVSRCFVLGLGKTIGYFATQLSFLALEITATELQVVLKLLQVIFMITCAALALRNLPETLGNELLDTTVESANFAGKKKQCNIGFDTIKRNTKDCYNIIFSKLKIQSTSCSEEDVY